MVLPRSVAIEAAERVNGFKLLGRRIRIKLNLSHDSPSVIVQERNRNGWAQIHFSFITSQVTHAIGEEVLDHIFSSIGAIADVAIKQHSITFDPPRQTAYGFIFYYETEAAQRAIQEMKHVHIDGIMFDCNWSNQRDADTDARRKLLARQQKPSVSAAALSLHQISPQYTSARRLHSSSPVMAALGYDLSMAMGGLSMGLAGLTMSQPMANSMAGMYGPPLPPSPMGLGMQNRKSMVDMNMSGLNYYSQQAVSPSSPQLYHTQHQGGNKINEISPTGSFSPQGATNMNFLPPPPSQMSSSSTDSSTVMLGSSMSTMDGSMLQQHGMYEIAPVLPDLQGVPSCDHNQVDSHHLPRSPVKHSAPAIYGTNMSGGGYGYMRDGIASSDCVVHAAAARGGYYVLGRGDVCNHNYSQSSSTTLSSSSPPRQTTGSEC